MSELPEGWQVIHSPQQPLSPPSPSGYQVGTIIRHVESGRQWQLVSDQRDGPYWSELAPDRRIRHE